MPQSEPDHSSAPTSAPSFPTTQWSMVLAAGAAIDPNSAAALEQLCLKYWHPLYAYVRRHGHSAEDARDLTQAFFARLLEKKHLSRADEQRGRFRAFLMTSLRRFLNDEWDRATAAKRGGGWTALSIDIDDAEDRYRSQLSDDLTPEKVYEQHWAMAVLDHVLARLSREYAAAGKAAEFEALQRFLWGGRGSVSYADVAADLGATEGAVKVAVYRLRFRYGETLRSEIAQTVATSDDLEDEIRRLFTAWD